MGVGCLAILLDGKGSVKQCSRMCGQDRLLEVRDGTAIHGTSRIESGRYNFGMRKFLMAN